MSDLRYVVISPAKDEAERIDKTITSMLRQTARPVRWMIVDDGSSDNTFEIVKSYAQMNSWITAIRVDRDAERKIGSAEIRAFEIGFRSVDMKTVDLVVKLDCDLILESDYFERLIAHFDEDPMLGIASGVYLEQKGNTWAEVVMPDYHASGASKMIRTKCLADIGGFPLVPGWDTADEIKAQTRGWKTRHFPELKFFHLRQEGAAIGGWRTGVLHGNIYFVTGGGVLFLLFKCIHRLFLGRPIVFGGIAMFYGYLNAWRKGTPQLVTDVEASFYRRQLNRRLWKMFLEKVGFRKSLNQQQRTT